MKLSEYRENWALVTGASSGIGRAFAMELAAAGMNLVLVARRQSLLDALAADIAERSGIRTRVVVADLARPDAASDISGALGSEGIRVRLLCNNAAFGHWGRFEAASRSIYQDMIQVNMGAMVALCHAFLPDLTGFPSSVLINVSSAAAFQPIPYMAVYAASKAFVLSFSQALYGEWKDRGVLVQTLVPGPTETGFDATAGAYESALTKRDSPERVVRDSIAHLASATPLALSARGTFVQRAFAGLFPPKIVIRNVAKRFKPPN